MESLLEVEACSASGSRFTAFGCAVERRFDLQNLFILYTYICAYGKGISVSYDVYEMLRAVKRRNESFSDVIRRLIKKSSISKFSGTLSKETAKP